MDISKLYAELRDAGYTDEQALCKLRSDISKEANKAAMAYEAKQAKEAKEKQKKEKIATLKKEIFESICKYYSLKGIPSNEVKHLADAAVNGLDSIIEINSTFPFLF